MTELDRLIAATDPPDPGVDVDWGRVEAELGTVLPSDYKQLVGAFGLGKFADFLTVFQPESIHEFALLSTQIEIARSNLGFLKELEADGGEVIPFDMEELLPVAGTDNGDTVYWHRAPGAGPDAWAIVVNEARGDRWFRFQGGITDFLAAVFVDRVRVDVFPASLSSRAPAFTPDNPGID